MCAEKTTFLGKDDIFMQRRLNHSGVGGRKLHLEECTWPELTQP